MPLPHETENFKSQSAEFNAVQRLVKIWQSQPATVDDSYPHWRHDYENAMRDMLRAAVDNGRAVPMDRPSAVTTSVDGLGRTIMPKSETGTKQPQVRKIITLCGSTRFPEAFDIANMHLTMQGYIVLSVGCFGHANRPRGSAHLTSHADNGAKENLDKLHLDKIAMSDAVFVVNPGGYVGDSTQNEIAYAKKNRKAVMFMFNPWLGN